MRKRNREVALFLTGGLGNQLFQLAAALNFANGRTVKVYENIGKPRVNERNEAEIFSLNVEKIYPLTRSDFTSHFLTRASGYLLRSRIWPKSLERIIGFQFLVRLAAALTFSLIMRRGVFPVTSSNVGYSNLSDLKIISRTLNPYLIGYFQSHVWPDSVKHKLRDLRLIEKGKDLTELELLAALAAPIVIHIRRGDYKSEDSFGLPGVSYYREAMKLIDKEFSHRPIWVFSDEEEEARAILNWLPEQRTKYISNVDDSSAASLMAMRLGCAYVIANSTFSWWGAFLSRADHPIVVAPQPWFTGQAEPIRLIPSDWIRIEQ